MYTIKNTTGGCGAKGAGIAPPGNPGDVLYLVSSGVAGAAANVLYTGDGNLYAANSITTTNVFATTYYGDGGLLTNVFVQPFANLVVSNSVTTTNVFATTYYGDGGLLTNVFVQPFANLVVSNSVTTTNVFARTANVTNVFATTYYGDGGLLSNITTSGFVPSALVLQPFANLVSTNALVTTNIFAMSANIATMNVGYLTVDSAVVYGTSTLNVYGTSNLTNVTVIDTFNVNGSMTANAANATFFFDTFTIPYINTQVLNVASNMNFTGPLATFSNLTVPGSANIEYLSVSNLSVTGNLIVTATNVQTTNALVINNSGTSTAFKVTQNEPTIHTHNVAEFWDATTLAMVIDPEGNVAIHTVSSPGYALTVTDPANFETLYIRGKNGTPTLNVTGNITASNAITTTNIFALSANISFANIANIYTTNIVGFIGSQWTSGTGNVYYLNGVGIGTSAVNSNLTVQGNLYASNAVTATALYGNVVASNVVVTPATGVTGINVTGNLYASNAVTATALYGNVIASNVVVTPATGVTGINVTGNIYASNAVTATSHYGNVVASNVVVTPVTGVTGINVTGNLYVSNAVTATALYGNVSASNVVVTPATGVTGINVTGNLYVSNAVTATALYGNVSASNVVVTPATGVTGINVTGNLYVSNAVTATSHYGNVVASNVVVTPATGVTGINVTGNLYASNAVTTTNVFANTLTLTGTAGQTTLYVKNNVFVSDTITKIIDNTSLAMYVGGGTISSTTTRSINTYSTSYPNFLATGGSAFYFNDTPVTALTAQAINNFGQTCAMSADGNSVIVTGYGSGLSPYVYRFSGGSWDSGTALTAQAVTNFGQACAISADGNTVVVTGQGSNQTPYVYRFSGGSWNSGTALAGQSASIFGWSCAMSADGNTIVVMSLGVGYPYLYRFSGGSWDTGTLLTLKSVSFFGQTCHLSADGNVLLVTGNGTGATPIVYRFSGGSWDSGTALTGQGISNFGFSSGMSADGNTVIITGLGSGTSPYVYRYSAGSWNTGTALTGKAVTSFGFSSAMSADGNSVIVAGNGTGQTPYVYRYTGGTWSSGTALTAQAVTNFGNWSAMSADGNTVIVTGLGGGLSPYVYVLDSRFRINNTLNIYGGSVGISTTTPTANVHIVGNLYASNAVTTTALYGNVVASNVVVTPATGVTGINVTGNLYASNAVTATALYGNVVASNVVVTPATGVTGINVTGNLYASNAVTATVLYGNVIASNVVVTPATGVTGINVTGNLYASNAITTINVFSTNVTATNVTGTSVIGTHYGVLTGSNTVSASSATFTTAFGQSASSTLTLIDGTRSLNFDVNAGAGNYNGITGAGDQLIWGSAGSLNTGTLTIAPHNQGTVGLRIGSTANTITIASNVTTFQSNGAATVMTLTNGNVGIGTASPLNQFVIQSSTGDSLQVSYDTILGGSGGIRVMNYYSSSSTELAALKIYSITTTTGALGFFTNNGTGQTERMRISSIGYVGIGTTAPTTTLQVTGNVYASNAVTTTNVFTTNVYFASGLTAATPAATKGAFEFNGTGGVFYSTPQTIRGISPSQHFYMQTGDVAFGTTANNTAAAMFPSVATGITLQAGKYYLRSQHVVTVTSSATAGTTTQTLTFAGTAVYTSNIMCRNTQGLTAPGTLISAATQSLLYKVANAAGTISAGTTNTSTAITFYTTLEGQLDVQTAGTFLPQIAFANSASGALVAATPGVRIGSFILLEPLGPSVTIVNVGAWA